MPTRPDFRRHLPFRYRSVATGAGTVQLQHPRLLVAMAWPSQVRWTSPQFRCGVPRRGRPRSWWRPAQIANGGGSVPNRKWGKASVRNNESPHPGGDPGPWYVQVPRAPRLRRRAASALGRIKLETANISPAGVHFAVAAPRPSVGVLLVRPGTSPKAIEVIHRRIPGAAHLRAFGNQQLFRHRCPPSFYGVIDAMLAAGSNNDCFRRRIASPTNVSSGDGSQCPRIPTFPATSQDQRPGGFRSRSSGPVEPTKTLRGSGDLTPRNLPDRRLARWWVAGLRRSMVRSRLARWPHQCANPRVLEGSP